MKKTKIVCSIGPSSGNVETFQKMVEAGCNVARINFSHATLEEKINVVNVVKKVRELTHQSIGILYDTKGPEFRNGIVKDGGIHLIPGKTIKIVKENVIGDEEKFSVNHPNAVDSLEIGNIILLENGLMSIKVIEKGLDYVNCEIINGGILESRKSISVPGVKLDIPFISPTDYEDIVYACQHDGNFLACSFTSFPEEILEVRKILEQNNRNDMKIIAKIESKTGMDNLEQIALVSDGIMVARGDLGVEMPMEDLPICQKKIASTCRKYGKICIIATEMLESMKKNPRPTRAEVTDIANAVFMGADAVMLSGETTTGNYPVEAVTHMAKICEHIEMSNEHYDLILKEKAINPTNAIAKSVSQTANDLKAKLVVIPTLTGYSAELVSNFEPSCPILTLTTNEEIANGLTLNYGLFPKVMQLYDTLDEVIYQSIVEAKKFIPLIKNDIIIITGGFNSKKEDIKNVKTNLMKIEVID